MKQMEEHAGVVAVDAHVPSDRPLETAIRRFFAKRAIEAATAVSLVALTSFSQSYALSVGELNVTSALGQPLRAWVEIATTPGETLNTRCMRMPIAQSSGIPGITGLRMTATITATTTTLHLAGNAPLREPMSEVVLNIDCAGAPALERSFLVLLDPPSSLDIAPLTEATVATSAAVTTVAPVTSRPPRSVRRSAPARGSIAPGSNYVVQPGDILSVIASRVEGRPEYSVWPIAQRIYETNPTAFDGRDPNTLRVGATIRMPSLTGRLAVDGSPRYRRGVVATRAPSAPTARNANLDTSLTPEPAKPASEELVAAATAAVMAAARRPVSLQPAVVSNMAYSRRLSGLSMDRLRQRRSGVAALEPTAVVDPVEEPTAPVPQAAAPVAAATRPAEQTVRVVTTQRHWLLDWVWLAGGLALGGLATAFGMRRWLQQQREEQEHEIARAQRHETRLEESRKTRTEVSEPTIVVHEELPRVDFSTIGPAMDTIGSVEEVLATSVPSTDTEQADDDLTEDAPLHEDDGVVDDQPTLMVDALDPEELDFEAFDSPNEDDLELLAQDYAQSTGDLRSLLPGDEQSFEDTMAIMISPKQLEVEVDEDGTQLVEPSLDLELPVPDADETELALKQLETQVRDDLDDELTEAAIKLNSNLLSLDHSFGDEDDDDPTAQAEQLVAESADDVVEGDDDPTSSIKTQDSEEFYHLEASRICKVPELAFEQELEDDESKILSFRKQN